MPLMTKTITYVLAASAATGISAAASVLSGVSMLITGSLATGGVATLDSGGAARRVIITSAADDHLITFTIKGTDRYGRPQSEVVQGANTPTVVQSVKDYQTVTSIVPSGNTAGNVSAGTDGVGSSAPMIADWVPNGNLIACSTLVGATAVNYTIQEALDDLSPAWDLTANNPNWANDPNFTSQTNSLAGQLAGPFTMIRILINSGTGSITAKFVTPLIGGHI